MLYKTKKEKKNKKGRQRLKRGGGGCSELPEDNGPTILPLNLAHWFRESGSNGHFDVSAHDNFHAC